MTYLDKVTAAGELPAYTSHDKAVSLGMDPLLYGNNRPDVFYRLDTHWVIVEVDETQHRGKTYSCERRRELELCNCANGLPVHIIRFNPDTFSTKSKSSRVVVPQEAIAKRHVAVVAAIKNAVEQVNPTGITVKKLYFDCGCVGEGGKHPCNFVHTSHYADHEAFLLSFQ
jgi:hypothetical protein